MTVGYLLIDGNSIGFAAQATKRLSIGGKEVQAIYGSLRMLRPVIAQNIMLRPIVLWDGRSWRKNEFAEYKANRDDNPKMKALRDAYKMQRPDISRALRMLGVWQLMAINYEADDLAGMLVKRAKRDGQKVIMLTADRDWLQLVGERVSWYDLVHNLRIDTANFQAITGYRNAEEFLAGKTLQGDGGDNIPGVGGIGEKGAKDLLERYASVGAFFEHAPNHLRLGEKLPKKWVDFLNNATGGHEKYLRNLRLMNLMQGAPLPERLTLTKGTYDEAAFTEFCHEHAFRSILNEFADWLQPFRANALERDIAA